VGGPVAMAAAAYACWRIGSMIRVPRPVRGFWRRFSHGAVCILIGACASLAMANNDPGISPYVAAPTLVGGIMCLLGFLHLPLGRRSPLGWARLLLDGATVAVAGTLIFWYVILDLAPANTSRITGTAAAARQRLAALHGSCHGDVNHQRSWRSRQVAAGDVDLVRSRQPRDASDDRIEVLAWQIGGECEREQSEARRGAHRRQVAEVDGQRAMTDCVWRRESTIEVNPFNDRVDGQHLNLIAHRFDNRRIVADTDQHPRRRRC